MFADAEIGLPKAMALARRYSAAWGVPIDAHHASFSEQQLLGEGRMRVIVGCVDNAAARGAIATAMTKVGRTWAWDAQGATYRAPLLWWLDTGNDRQSGQVLLGSTAEPQALAAACALEGLCTETPLPTLQAPELLLPRPDEQPSAKLSCAELVALDLQALSVNARVAAEAGDMLMRLLITHDLKRFATYFDLPSGTARSSYNTPAELAKFITTGRARERRRRAA